MAPRFTPSRAARNDATGTGADGTALAIRVLDPWPPRTVPVWPSPRSAGLGAARESAYALRRAAGKAQEADQHAEVAHPPGGGPPAEAWAEMRQGKGLVSVPATDLVPAGGDRLTSLTRRLHGGAP